MILEQQAPEWEKDKWNQPRSQGLYFKKDPGNEVEMKQGGMHWRIVTRCQV